MSIFAGKEHADARVTLPAVAHESALVQSSTAGTVWEVHNLLTDWGCCNCSDGLRGNICCHQLEVISMMRPCSEAELVRKLGTFKGQIQGGMQALSQQWPPFISDNSIADDQPFASSSNDDDQQACQIAAPLSRLWWPLSLQCSYVLWILASLRARFEALLDVEFQALPGRNSMLRWKPANEAGLSKINRKRQASYIGAAAAADTEPAADPLPLPSKAPKKKSFRQVLAAGVLAEQTNNTQPHSRQPCQPSQAQPTQARWPCCHCCKGEFFPHTTPKLADGQPNRSY